MVSKREWKITEVVAIFVLVICLAVSYAAVSNISNYINTLETAIQVTDDTQFAYALRTLYPTGVWGTGKVVLQPVNNNYLIHTYGKIVAYAEKYTTHSREVCTGTGKSRSCYTEYYETWDSYKTVRTIQPTLTFMSVEFPSPSVEITDGNILPLNNDTVYSQYVNSISGGYIYEGNTFWWSVGDIRWYMKTVPYSYDGVMYIKNTTNGYRNEDGRECGCKITGQSPNEQIQNQKDTLWFMMYVFPILVPVILTLITIGYFLYSSDLDYKD